MKKEFLFLLIFMINIFPLYALFGVKTDWDNEASVLEVLKHDKYRLLGNKSRLQYVSESLKNKKSLVLKAVSYNGDNLKHASKYFRKDGEVILKAIEEKEYGMSCPYDDLYTSYLYES